jgi:hypothetical protein
MKRFYALICAICFTFCSTIAFADDNAAFLINLFNKACIPNMGQPAAVRKWAGDKYLPLITDSHALQVFVGNNDNGRGVAWGIPSPTKHHFALSLRAATQACAVWAEQADPVAVESMFIKEVVGAVRPGLEARKSEEKVANTHLGVARYLAYIVTTTGNTDKGFEFILTTSERPGGPFQASIQLAGVLLNQ